MKFWKAEKEQKLKKYKKQIFHFASKFPGFCHAQNITQGGRTAWYFPALYVQASWQTKGLVMELHWVMIKSSLSILKQLDSPHLIINHTRNSYFSQ